MHAFATRILAVLNVLTLFAAATTLAHAQPQVKLIPDDSEAVAAFGQAVDIDGGYAVVGAREDNIGTTYIFHREGNSWVQEAELTPSDVSMGDAFGEAVAIDGAHAIVGAPRQGNGSAYVFHHDGTSWTQEAKLTAAEPSPGAWFGHSVAIDGDRIVVGEHFTGSAYVFGRDGDSWTQETTLTTSNPSSIGGVAIEEDYIIVGAPGPPGPPNGESGSADVFASDGDSWTHEVTLFGEGFPNDDFGGSVAMSGEYVIIGAPGETEGVGSSNGGAYVFHREGSSWTWEARLSGEGTSEDVFGRSVATDGTNAVVGIQYALLGPEGPQDGAAYLFRRDGNAWSRAGLLTAADASAGDGVYDDFGWSVAVEEGDILIGAPSSTNDQGASTGAAYVSDPAGATPILSARLTAFGTQAVATNFVNVLFRATDEDGRGIDIPADIVDQNVDFFRVFDDGQEVSPTAPETFYQVLKFEQDGAPIPYRLRTVLLLDNSTSVGNDLDEIRDAARTIVDNLAENQEVALYVFDSEVTLLQDFTGDTAALHAAIDGISVGSPSTALFNGLVEGLGRWEDQFELTDNGEGNIDVDIERGFLVLLSDGEDTAGGASLSDVLAARGDKRVYAIGYGSVNGSVLNEVGNAGVYTVGTAGELPAVFAEVQAEIENDARSFYLLNYSSPRRSDQTWPLEICLSNNTYDGPDACAETAYTSAGFTDPVRGVFVNRSIERLYGVDEVDVSEGGTVLTATTILGLNEPEYEWSSSDESQVIVEAITGTNQAIATRVGPAGGTATITVSDVANDLTRSVNATLVVPVEEGATAASFALGEVFPNPSRGRVQVALEAGASTDVQIVLYDVLGRRLLTAHDGLMPAGSHVVRVQTKALAAGVYFLRVEAGDSIETRRFTVIQ